MVKPGHRAVTDGQPAGEPRMMPGDRDAWVHICGKPCQNKCLYTPTGVGRCRLRRVEGRLQADTKRSVVAKKKACKKMAQKKARSTTAWAPAKPTTQLYQFKITLFEITPKIWRRIQIKDCFLHDLHWHIQGAFGWTNSHLHDFDVGPDRYGIPSQIDDPNYPACKDSTTTPLSDVLPKDGKRFVFKYTYDMGDNWGHEVLFEGVLKPDRKTKYPICLEGERACPPEDCGGEMGYEHLLEVLGDPQHEEYEDLHHWAGDYDPERFSAKDATAQMREYN